MMTNRQLGTILHAAGTPVYRWVLGSWFFASEVLANRFLCAALLILQAGSLYSQQPSTPLRSDVLEWIDQLDAATVSKRQAAEKSLIEAGPGALEFLPESNANLSVEAQQRLDRVRESLLAQRTEMQSAATRVRLDAADTLGKALEAISRDSGVEFDFTADPSQPIQTVNTPMLFWQALDLVLDQASLDINFYGGDRQTLQLVRRSAERPSRSDSAAYASVYRIEPTAITARRVLNQPSLNAVNVSLEIAWEPRLTPIGLSIPVAQLQGVLDDGERLKPQLTAESIDIATNRDVAVSQFYLPMQLPDGQPRKIESISGVIQALLPGARQSFELALSEPAANEKRDAMEVRVEAIRNNGPLHEVRIGVTLQDAGRSLESHRQWIFENDAYVQRADGSRVDHLGYEVYRQTAEGVGISYLFDLGHSLRDMTFIYQSPTAVVPKEISFVLQDIPLP